MKNSLNLFLSLILFGVSFFFLPHLMAATPIDRVVAIAGDEIITQSQLDRIIQARKEAGEPLESKTQRWQILRQLIEEQLIVQEARKRGISITDDELEFALRDIENRNRFPDRESFKKAVSMDHLSWEQYVDNLRNQLTALKLLSREVTPSVTLSDEAIKAYYHRHPELFRLPDRVKVSQILLAFPDNPTPNDIKRIKNRADQIYEEIRSGTNFIQMVQKYSDGREKKDGGSLGFFKKGDLTPKIDEVIFHLNEHEISPPIETPLGIHIFKVDVREVGKKKPLETVEQQIKEHIMSQKTADLRTEWIDDLWKKSFIEIK